MDGKLLASIQRDRLRRSVVISDSLGGEGLAVEHELGFDRCGRLTSRTRGSRGLSWAYDAGFGGFGIAARAGLTGMKAALVAGASSGGISGGIQGHLRLLQQPRSPHRRRRPGSDSSRNGVRRGYGWCRDIRLIVRICIPNGTLDPRRLVILNSDHSYFRLVTEPRRKFLVFVAHPEYLVKTPSGSLRRVRLRDLPGALDVSPEDSRRDWQECEMLATRLFRAGESDKWVEFPTGLVINDSELGA